jgi:uncharacterized protein YecT (DUF1311 family)
MKKLFIIFLFLFAGNSYGQKPDLEKDTAAIEKKLNADLDKANGGLQSALAIGTALESYDKLLNSYYQKCLSKIKPADKNQFIATQKAWLAWKVKEVKLIVLKNSPKYSGPSDIMAGTNAEEELRIVRNRVVDLYNYWEIFSSDYGK